jgi:ATP-dependent Clp protease adaptor protein ClpS
MNTKLQEQVEVQESTETKAQRNYKVILLNDEDHTYDYVVELLCSVCGMKRDQAFRCAVEVDLSGQTIVYYSTAAKCEQVAQKIKNFGPDHRLTRSMTSMHAVVERVD